MAPSLRSLALADAAAVEAMLLANRPVFSDVECREAVAMIRESFAKPDDDDPYRFLVAEVGGRVAGYACFGSVPFTQGTFDLYFIAVDPGSHGAGVGRALLAGIEDAVAASGGRIVVVETSSRADYAPARHFYERAPGYETAARLRDFYRPGEDKIVYVKRIDGS